MLKLSSRHAAVFLALALPAGLAHCGDSTTEGSAPGGEPGTSTPDGGAPDAQVDASSDAPGQSDSPVSADSGPPLRSCPTSGPRSIKTTAPCVVFTPAEASASSAGANADVDQYALEPAGARKGALVVHLNSSLGSPGGQIADPLRNVYNAAALEGFHVLAVAYRSTEIVGALCAEDAACYGPTRHTLVLGQPTAGAHASLANMRDDEGIVQRTAAALRLLAARQPNGGWEAFLDTPGDADPVKRVAWNKVVATGHSQGGGHAGFLGSIVKLRRVVQFASTCDAPSGTPAPWTDASGSWATSPASAFVGFASPTTFAPDGTPTGGDTICPHHVKVWENMGMDPSRMHDDAATCGAGANTHADSIRCVENFPRWRALFE